MSDKTNSSILNVENMSDEREDSEVGSKIDCNGDGFQRLIEKLSLEDDDDDDDVAGEGESSVRERKDEEDHPIPSANHLVAKESDDDESESKDDDSNCPVASGSSGPGLRPDGKPWASEEEKREYYQNTISQIESSADENDDDQWEDIEDEDDQDMAQYIKDSLKYYGLLRRNENDLEEVTRLKELSDSYNSSEEAKQDAEIIKMVIQAIYSIDSVLDKFPLPKALILDKKAKIMRKKCLKLRKDLIALGFPEDLLPGRKFMRLLQKKK